MKQVAALFLLLCITHAVLAQKRYLVTPSNQAIPLKPNESAMQVMTNLTSPHSAKHSNAAGPSSHGYPPGSFPVTDTIATFAKDVLAMWFTAPASGTIDSIFWQAGDIDPFAVPEIFIRVSKSNIGPHSGPGNGYPIGCEGWGYYFNTNDQCYLIGAFVEDVTDTTWISNVAPGPWGASFPPAGSSIWGFSGVFATDHADAINSIAMNVAFPLDVNVCDTFLVSMRINGNSCSDTTHPVTWWGSRTDAPYPSRVWKFYEHTPPSPCDGGSHNRGWYAFGGPKHDSTTGLVLNWWYVMTVADSSLPTCSASGIPTMVDTAQLGWNMVSVPLVAPDFQKASIYPTASSAAFTYSGTYQKRDTLKNGEGYWVKSDSMQAIAYFGAIIQRESVDVRAGWNMVGSITTTIPTSTIASIPGGMTVSPFFGYADGYAISDSIVPGKAYWVNASEAGKLVLSSVGVVAASSRIRIVPTSELPPPAPDDRVMNASKEIPREFGLDQNYPNPFNPTTVIRYQLPVTTSVSLKVFDMLGQEVTTLVDKVQEAGYKSVEWNASGIASGVYLYKLQAGTYSEVRKLILLR